MARKHRLKKRADNPFTKITGKPVIKLSGTSDCIVVNGKMITATPIIKKPALIKTVAAYLYLSHPQTLSEYNLPPLLPSINEHTIQMSDIKKVTQTCGIDQCVNASHLQVILKEKNGW